MWTMTALDQACATVAAPPGYRLRAATANDAGAIERLVGDEIDAIAGTEVRLFLKDPSVGPARLAIAEHAGEPVGCLVLLPGVARFGPVTFGYGQIEFVATHRDHRQRGVMRALLDAAHLASARSDDLFQLIGGIEYVYRRVGYEYALAAPRRYLVPELPAVPSGWRVDEVTDPGEYHKLQEGVQAHADLAIPPLPGHYEWLARLDHTRLAVARQGSRIGGCARIYADDQGVEVTETVALLPGAGAALLAHAGSIGTPLAVQVRPGAEQFMVAGATPDVGREGYYLRVADPVATLRRLAALLDARLADSPFADWSGSVGITRYVDAFRIDVVAGRVVAVEPIDPATNPPVMVPPDRFAALLFGELGLAGLEERYPDVVVDDADLRPLARVLFPPVASDVIHF